MNEPFFKSSLLVLMQIQRHLMAAMASKQLINLNALHTQLTGEITVHLGKKQGDDPAPHPDEQTIVELLDAHFSAASLIETATRDAGQPPAS